MVRVKSIFRRRRDDFPEIASVVRLARYDPLGTGAHNEAADDCALAEWTLDVPDLPDVKTVADTPGMPPHGQFSTPL